MSEVSDIDVDYDPGVWIEVPITFSPDRGETADEWAQSMADEATVGFDNRDEARERIREGALALCRIQHPVASRRFWFYPLSGEALSVAHHFAIARDPADDPVDILIGDAGAYTQPAVVELEPATPGRLVRVAFPIPIASGETEDAVVGCLRVAKVTATTISIVEVIDEDLTVIGQMLEHVESLAESIRVETAGVGGTGE